MPTTPSSRRGEPCALTQLLGVKVKKSLTAWLLSLSSFAGVALILAIIAYAVKNDSGHTGMNPYLGLWLFIPIALAGIVRLFVFRRAPGAKWLGLASLLAGVLGIGLLVYLDVTDTLLEYEVWNSRGMP